MKPHLKIAWLFFLFNVSLIQNDELKTQSVLLGITTNADGSFTISDIPGDYSRSSVSVQLLELPAITGRGIYSFHPKALVRANAEWTAESCIQFLFVTLFPIYGILLSRQRLIISLPGVRLNRLAEFFYSPKTYEEVFVPTLRDLHEEYFKAFVAGDLWKARWICIRGYWSFWSAVFAQLPISVVKAIYTIWKIGK